MNGDVERLADDLAAADAAHFGCGGCSECEDRPTLHARTVLASDWLAERDQKMQATGAALNVLAHGSQHPDMETYARIHNEGWDAAMLAQVAPDPTTADDWLAAHDAEVAARALRDISAVLYRDHDMPPNKDSHGYDYRMGWWDGVHHAAKFAKDRARADRAARHEGGADRG